MSLMGIDIGTTGCKAAVFSEEGRCISTAYREYSIMRPQAGYAQLDSRAVLKAVYEVIAAAASKTANDPIKVLSISSLGEAFVPVSSDRKILENSILSSDMRGEEFLNFIKNQISSYEFYKINPNIIGSNYSLPKLLWIKINAPDLYKSSYKFLLWADLVAFMLGAEPRTSFSLANRTLLYDITKKDWSDELLALSGIDRSKLPNIVASGTVIGQVSKFVAADLNLPNNTAIVVGGHDQCCNSLGAGVYQPGKAVCGIGTFECITPVYDVMPDPQYMLDNGLNVEDHIISGRYVSFIYNQSGSLVRWFRDTFASADRKLLNTSVDIYEVLSEEMPNEPTDLLTLPYFESTGTPHFITNASGVIAGLKINTQRGEILKSIMECTSFYFLESIGFLKNIGIDTQEFIVTGGGAKSDKWLQIKADIFGVPFVRPIITECTLAGAAMIAGISMRIFTDAQDAVSRFVKIDRTFEPNSKYNKIYKTKYAMYKQISPILKDVSVALHVVKKVKKKTNSGN